MFKNIKRSINNVRIKRKILILYFFGILLPILSLVTYFSYQIQSELSNREQALVEGELTRIKLNILTMVNTADILASTYTTDKDLAWALETYSKSSKEPITKIRSIDGGVLSNLRVHAFVDKINIYFENDELFPTEYAHFLSSEIQKSNWFTSFISSGKNIYLGCDNQDYRESLYIIRKLNLVNFGSNNLIKIDISSDKIRDSFYSEILPEDSCGFFLVNNNDQITVSGKKYDLKDINDIKKEKGIHIYEDRFDSDSLLQGWKIIVIPHKNIMYASLSNQISFLVLTSVIVLLFSMLLFYGLAHSIIYRLERLAGVMNRSKSGELTEIGIPMGSDEIGITSDCYNSMIQKISSLMDENSKAYDDLQTTNEELIATLDEVENKERQIDELIYTDKLTGLSNRFAISRYIDNQILEMKGNKNFAVGFLDIDNFKLINDTYGHDIGDDVIKQIGMRLKVYESPAVHIGRFGGDEFIITVKDFKDIKQLKNVLERIRITIKEPIITNDISFLLTLSMGVSLYAVDSKRRHELVKLADIALYKAKELGRDQIIFFENSMNLALSEKLKRQAYIREAIKDKNFVLYYQPYYDIHTKAMKGCEALLRWKHNYYFQISPQEVVQHIEEMGLMIDFGFWIIHEACLFAKRFNEDRSNTLKVSINISAVQLMQNDFVDKVFHIFDQTNVNIDFISFEMTESILMYSIEKGSSVINQLRNAGISISLDDFGTGYSSLKYFKELPITTLKIDKTFIDNVATNEYDEQLVDTMIQLAHNRKINVIAEGVETEEQLDRLKSLGCDMIQGYLFSKPVKETDLIKLTN